MLTKIFLCLVLLQAIQVQSEESILEDKWRDNLLGIRRSDDAKLNKRDVIEEENVRNGAKKLSDITQPPEVTQWIPQPSIDEEEPKLAVAADDKVANAEALLDRQNGREARGATKDQWIKLPYLNHPEARKTDELSSSSSHSIDDQSPHRLPTVNFVTQGKNLQTAESRNQRDSSSRAGYGRAVDLRTDIYPPGRGRSVDYASYSRNNYYYPEDYSRRNYYDDAYYDDMYSVRKPYQPNYSRNRQRFDYYDETTRFKNPYDMYEDRADRPRRIIYYATLPDVARTPPNVYRYPNNQYRGYEDDRYYRDRYDDPYYRNSYYPRYPYSPLKKSETEGPTRDLSISESSTKDKTDALKRREEEARKLKEKEDLHRSRDYKYPISASMSVTDPRKDQHHTFYHDSLKMDNEVHRFDHPSFQAAVDDPYISRHN